MRCLATFCVFQLLILGSAIAQENPNTEISNHPFSAIDVGSLGTVGLQNGSLTVRLPILSFPQRGKLGYNLRYFYDSKVWKVHEVCDIDDSHDDADCVSNWEPDINASLLIAEQTAGLSPRPMVVDGNPLLQFVDLNGGSHLSVRTGNSTWVSADGTATLGSFPLVGASNGSYAGYPRFARSPDGILVYENSDGSATTEDSNGNEVTTSSGLTSAIVDTMNRQFNSMEFEAGNIDPLCGNGQSNITSYPGPNGQQTQVKTCRSPITISSNFGDFDEYNNPIKEVTSSPALVITSISVFDGNSWTTSPTWRFEYNTSYGDLTKVTLPGGGSVSYEWINIGFYNACATSVAGEAHISRYISARSEDAGDGSGPQRTTYSYNQLAAYSTGGNPNYTAQTSTVVTNPLGDTSIHEFSPIAYSCSDFETENRQVDHALGLLKTVDTDYSGILNKGDVSAESVAVNVFPIRVTTKLPNGSVSKIETDYDQQLLASGTQYSYGKPIQRREYDFGHGSPGALIRCTAFDYLAFDNPTYLGLNLVNLESSETSYAGSCSPQNQISQTLFGYDEAAVQASGVTVQLNTASFPSTAGTPRGNLTSVKRWMGNNQPSITATTTYFDTGMPYQATDPSSHTTTYSYDPQYFGAYRTATAKPDTSSPLLTHHTVSGTYDLYTGQLTSFTDENQNTTTLSLDALGRVYKIIYPADGGSAQITFDDDFLTIHQRRQMSSSVWSSVDSQYDGLGRLSRTATSNGNSGDAYNQADICYDPVGRRSFQSYAYQGAGLAGQKVCSGKGDGFSFDALGRELTVRHSDGTTATSTYTGAAVDVLDEGSSGMAHVERVSQSDALGRLLSVCEVTGQALAGVSPSACGQDVSKTGFLTSYTYDALNNLKTVTQGTLAQRMFNYDPASRLTSSYNPETGTTGYIYNPDGTLNKRTRPAPNQSSPAVLVDTNYSYDELQRLRTVSYQQESTQASDPYTPSVTMQYDETSLLGSAVSNSSGKLTSEVVSFPGQTAISAGRYFTNFDTMGRLKSEQQCPPRLCSSTNGFDLQYGYDYLGNVTSVQNSQFGTQSNTYNIASQLTMINHTLNGNTPVASSITYGAFGLTDTILGNGLEEANIYDNRGRITSRQLGRGQSTPSLPVSAAVGMVLVSGSTQIQAVQQYPSGSITISGQEQKLSQSDCPSNNRNCYLYDSGTVSVTIAGYTESYSFGQGSSANAIASAIVGMFNNGPTYTGATISNAGGVISVVGQLGAPGGAYPISAQTSYDSGDFSSPSFTAVASGSTLSGGGAYTLNDAGTAFITVNGHQDSVPFVSCDNAATITYALINAINADSASSVTAAAYESAILLTSKQTGTVGNGYAISAGETSSAGLFTGSSYVLNTSGAALEGGVDPGPAPTLTGPLYNFTLAYLPNGNIQSAKDTVNGNWSYTYDDLDRLSTAASPALSFQYLYDRFGNRLQQQLTAGTYYNPSPVTSSAANRIDGQCYDAAGNLLDETLNCAKYIYDAENRLVSTNGGPVYVYDAEGSRVAKQSGTPGAANTDTNEYLLDASGEQIAELDGSGNLVHTNVYAGGRLWSTFSNGAMHYHTTDWLGTRRVQTEANASVSLNCTGLPFGDGQNCTGTDTTEQHFTGKEEDAESGLDYFGARYYKSSIGRFMSPDWSAQIAPIPYSKLANPSTLNLYSYVSNNPVNLVDNDGHDYAESESASCEAANASGNYCSNNQPNLQADQNSLIAARQAFGLQAAGFSAQQENGPSGPSVTFVFERDAYIPDHVSMYVSDGQSFMIYDPDGTYAKSKGAGEGDVATADDGASRSDYLSFERNKSGSAAIIYTYAVNAIDAHTIQNNIMTSSDRGDNKGLLPCARSVSGVISGVGPFRSVEQVKLFPGYLLTQISSIPHTKE